MGFEDTKLEVLNDHYKDSFLYVREYIGIRDRLLFYILITITILLSQIFSPETTGNNLSQFLTKKLELNTPLDISFIGCVIWFWLLSLVIKYFQTVIYIEGQYVYIHKVEEELSKKYSDFVFSREGKSYLKGFPLFRAWAHIIYRIIFPVLLMIVVFVKISTEWLDHGASFWILLVNSIIAVCILVTTYIYLKTIFGGSKKSNKGDNDE